MTNYNDKIFYITAIKMKTCSLASLNHYVIKTGEMNGDRYFHSIPKNYFTQRQIYCSQLILFTNLYHETKVIHDVFIASYEFNPTLKNDF